MKKFKVGDKVWCKRTAFFDDVLIFEKGNWYNIAEINIDCIYITKFENKDIHGFEKFNFNFHEDFNKIKFDDYFYSETGLRAKKLEKINKRNEIG